MARDNVRRLPSGRWQVRFVNPETGERIPATFDRKAEAKDWLNQQRSDLSRGSWRDPRSGKVKLSEFAADWLAAHAVRETTKAGYETDLRIHINPHLGDYPLSQITPAMVEKWFAGRMATGKQAAAHHAYRTLSTVMNAAVERDRIAKSPCVIPRAAQPSTDNVRRALNESELWKLVDAMHERYKALVLVAAFGGPRWGEAIALTAGDVNEQTGQISIEKQLNARGEVVVTKSAAGRRSVVVPSFVTDALKPHLGEDPRALLFTNLTGGPMNKGNFRIRY